jgi:hypothetical protein
MAITSTQENGTPIVRKTRGAYLDSAGTPAAATLTLGYTPYYVMWLNATDRIQYEWYEGMAAGTTLKTVAAGTRTLDTADVAITVNTDGTVTIGAAAILQNKQNYWRAV